MTIFKIDKSYSMILQKKVKKSLQFSFEIVLFFVDR